MKLTNESLKKLVTEVINAEKARMDAWLQNFMDNMPDEKKAEIAARNEKEYAKAPNSDAPLSWVKAQVAEKEKEDFLKKRAREREAETKKGFSRRGINMGPDDPGDVTDIYGDQVYEEGLMYEGDDSILEAFNGATLEEGDLVCEGCLFEMLQEASCGCPDLMGEAEYQGRKVTLNKPTRGDVKKFKVYVKDPTTGNIKKVNFGHGGTSAKAKGEKTMKIRKNNPKARKSFRARHNCSSPGPKTKARYWSCKKW